MFTASRVPAVSRAIQRPSSTAAMTHEATPALPLISYVKVPYKDTFSDVGYVDVGSADDPVVIALHGAPGGVQDFAELYGPLAEKGIRFVVPEFPGYGRTTIENAAAFDESTEARATLVHNFLTAVGISRVTAVAGHSMGVATAFHLAANYDYFQSVVYLSGIGFKPHRSISPYWLTQLYASGLENMVTEPLMKSLLSVAYSLQGFKPNDIQSGMRTGILSASRIGFEKFEENASRVRDKGLPVFFAFTQSDRLVEWEMPMNVVKHFDTSEESISWLDAKENVVKGASVDDVSVSFPWAMIFERGGHFVHRSHSAVVSQRIVSFVKQVDKLQPTSA